MKKWVSAAEKKSFLKWFLENHRLKRTEARKVLESIVNKPYLLDNISFTEKINLNEKTIIISSVNSDEPGFVFYHNQRKTDDVSRVLGELSSNPSDKFNIILHFYGKRLNQRYMQLVETNAVDHVKQYKQYEEHSKEIDELIEKIMLEKNIETVKKQIDEALDRKDEQLFNVLVTRLKELQQT